MRSCPDDGLLGKGEARPRRPGSHVRRGKGCRGLGVCVNGEIHDASAPVRHETVPCALARAPVGASLAGPKRSVAGSSSMLPRTPAILGAFASSAAVRSLIPRVTAIAAARGVLIVTSEPSTCSS